MIDKKDSFDNSDKRDVVVIKIDENILTFYCKILEFTDTFIKFVDIKNMERTYNVKYIVSVSRKKEDEKDE